MEALEQNISWWTDFRESPCRSGTPAQSAADAFMERMIAEETA